MADIYAALDEPPQIIDLHLLPPEIFSPSSYEKPPDSFTPFEEPIGRADGIVIVTPEYNGSIPGIFKYYIDMLVDPEQFAGKPVALVGLAAGMWGALRPVEQIEAMLLYLGAVIYPKRVNLAGDRFMTAVKGIVGKGLRYLDLIGKGGDDLQQATA